MVPRRYRGIAIQLVSWAALGGACSPAVARVSGVVTSTRSLPDGATSVCLQHVVDAGSNYGDRRSRDDVCWSGTVKGTLPEPGSCITLQSIGEASELLIEQGGGGC